MHITSPVITSVHRAAASKPTKSFNPPPSHHVDFSGDYPTEFFHQAFEIGAAGWALFSAVGLGAIALFNNRDKSSK